jgi:hypothetical protein
MLAHLVTATIPPGSEVFLEVRISGYDAKISVNYGHIERDNFKHATPQQLIQLGLTLWRHLLPRFAGWKHNVFPHQSRFTEYQSAGVDDIASVFVTPVAARHFRLVLLLCLLDMTVYTHPVHRLGICNCPVVLDGN